MKSTVISIIVAGVLIGGAIMLSSGSPNEPAGSIENVSVVDGKQIVTVTAKGKYSPQVSLAKADMPTLLRMQTRGTFDCTAALTIPAIGYRANLPASGITEIEIPPQKPGSTVRGVCAMGMRTFEVRFN